MPKKTTTKPLEQRVLAYIQRHHLMAPGDTVVVAVSGGPDSVCLLHVLNTLRSMLGIKFHAAHLDHQIRGAESKADALYVVKLAKKLGIPTTIEKRDVKTYRKEHKISLEEAAREVRYDFLAEVAGNIGAACVAVGHTQNDHVETILLHLIRGTGTRGLFGLQPVTAQQISGKKLKVVRPLLEISREDTVAYCARHRLHPRLDATNLSMTPLRNRIRLELLPLLKDYNPQAMTALLRTSRLAGDDIAFLEGEAKRLWRRVARKQDESIILDKESLHKQHSSLQRYLLRLAIENLVGNLKDIEARHIEEMLEALNKPAGKRINLPYGLTFTIDYDRYVLAKDILSLSPFPALTGEYLLKIPGRTIIPGWQIQADVISPDKRISSDDNFKAQLDLSASGKKLTVRARKRGDRFQPLGMKESKKLTDFMLDSRIPRGWRPHVPIICAGDKILWVVGYRIDESAKVTVKTEQVLRIKFKQIL